ncbi:MAG: helix-turn-helix domain-containing protein [Clostridia bacterium]|nr:helix-turn-helix domain-containing protein [Clostridia bacterium]
MSDYKAETGGRMFELRKSQGKSQAEVAEYIGLTVAAYQNYEAGRREAGYEVLCKIADMFNVSLDYLLGRTKVKEMNKLSADALTEEQVREIDDAIVSSYERLPLESRRAFIKMLEDLFGNIFEREDYGSGMDEDEDPQDSTA